MSSIVVMIVLGLLVIFSFVVAYFSARTWSILNVGLVVAVFVIGLVFVFLASATLKTHDTWRTQHARTKADVLAELDKGDRMRFGESDTVEQSDDTLVAMQGELEREILDRGRVWRSVRPGIQQGQIVVDMRGFGDAKCLRVGSDDDADVELEPEVDEEAQAPEGQHGVTANMVVYVFQEQSLVDLSQAEGGEARLDVLFPDRNLRDSDTNGFCRLPSYYLGQFRVTEAVGEAISLAPTIPLDQDQIARIKAAQGSTWSLYEILPVDRHDIFRDLDAEQLQAVMPRPPDLDNDLYAAVIEQYVRDGKEAGEGDDEETTGVWVKFLQVYDKIQVDAEIDESGQPVMVERDFDSSGLAVAPLLRQQNVDPDAGSRVEFSVGDTALFDAETATRLIDQGICEADEGGRVYRRRLRDYEYIFRQTSLASRQLGEEQARVAGQTEAVASAAEETARQIEYREAEKRKVEHDLSGWNQEVTQLAQLASTMETQDQQMRKRLSHLYVENAKLLAQLTNLQSQLRDVLGGRGE